MAKILITGGAGFIGSSIVDKLLQLGNEIIVIDNLSTGNRELVPKWSKISKLRFVHADILDNQVLRKLVDACDLVFHFAANPEVRIGLTNSKIDYEQNIFATYSLLEAIKNSSNCRKIVFTSSSTVYGEPNVIPTPEHYGPLIPVSLYGSSKLACEAMISGYCHMFNLSGAIVRLANVVGPTSTHGVIYDFIMKLSANQKSLEILGDGRQNKSYLYIDDCVDALIRVSEIEDKFQIFNVGSSDRIEVADIANIVISKLSLKNVAIKFTGGINGRGWKGDVKEMLLDCSKLREHGWKSKYNSREAVGLAVSGIINRLKKVRI